MIRHQQHVVIGSQCYPWKSSQRSTGPLSDKLHTNQLLNMHVIIGSCDESKVESHHFTIKSLAGRTLVLLKVTSICTGIIISHSSSKRQSEDDFTIDAGHELSAA